MNRRDFLHRALAGMAGVAAGAALWPRNAAGAGDARFPNVVYLLADDMGSGDPACVNPASRIPTPNMDRVAAEGMIFTDAHSGSAVCTPTRYGILTGRYCWRTRLKLGVMRGYDLPLIEPERLTVASLLKQAGYRTACIGKWHLGLDWATTNGRIAAPENTDYSAPIANGPLTRGFDYYFGIPASLDMIPHCYIENDHVVEAPTETTPGGTGKAFWREGPIAPHFHHAEVLPALTRKAVECIETHAQEHADLPLFLYFPLSAPHAPVVPSPDFQGKTPLAEYGDFVAQVDATVGAVLSALERQGMAENTLFIVTSDNGFAPVAGLDELLAHGHNPNYVYRGHKADIFEGGHRIPLLARWPGHVPAASRFDGTVCLTDLLATAAQITGQALPDNAGEDSVSMLPALLGTATGPLREATVHHSANGFFAIRRGPWKLILCGHSGGWSEPRQQDAGKLNLPPVQLYNLDEDIGEKNNVCADHPDIVEQLTKLLESYVEKGRSTPGAPQANEGRVEIWGPGGKQG